MRLYIPYRYALWRQIDNWCWERFHIPFRPRYFIQRALRGWSDADVWNLDGYLARVIAEGCEHLADVVHGYPPQFGDDALGRWQEILREIAKGMHGHLTWEDEPGYSSATYERMKAKRKKSLRLLETYFDYLWD